MILYELIFVIFGQKRTSADEVKEVLALKGHVIAVKSLLINVNNLVEVFLHITDFFKVFFHLILDCETKFLLLDIIKTKSGLFKHLFLQLIFIVYFE